MSQGRICPSQFVDVLLTGESNHIIKVTDPESANDRYLNEFKKRGLCAIKIPTLEYEFVNLDQLMGRLRSLQKGATQVASGLLITSPRAVEALRLAIESTTNSEGDYIDLSKLFQDDLIFTIGQRSAGLMREKLNLTISNGSESSGDGPNLVEFINKTLADDTIYSGKVNILFPCGNLSNQFVDAFLNFPKVDLDPIIVYETRNRANLKEAICSSLIDLLPTEPAISAIPVLNIDLVFFSPSGVNGVDLGSLESRLKQILGTVRFKLNFCAIGSTTASALIEKNLSVYVIADKPNPQSLVKSILSKRNILT